MSTIIIPASAIDNGGGATRVASPPGFYAEANGQQLLGPNTTAYLDLNTKDYNQGDYFDLISQNRFYAPVSGIYNFTCSVLFAQYNMVSGDRFDSGLSKAGTAIFTTLREFSGGTSIFPCLSWSTNQRLSQNEYVQFYVINRTGSNKYTYNGATYTNASATYLSP